VSRLVSIAVVVIAIGIAFADSSVVVLALPELYGHLDTTIVGVSWVITAYNAAVAVVAFVLLLVVRRVPAAWLFAVGLVIFAGASSVCALSNELSVLIVARCIQGAGGAMLLAGSLPVLASLTGSTRRGAEVWTVAGLIGASLGPALGGFLTQLFDWRAIFAVQVPLALVGLLAVARPLHVVAEEADARPPARRTMYANVSLGLLFGALVGVLFLAVLLVILVWGYSPIGGAAVVSILPLATVAARPLQRRLGRWTAACAGSALVALGLVALAVLPSSSLGYALSALAICGAGLGLAVPVFSTAALDLGAGLTRSGTLTIGVRHLGLVLALAVIAPILAAELPSTGDRVTLQATGVLLDAPIGLGTKVPVAVGIAGELERARSGQIPNLARPFDDHGAQHDPAIAAARDNLIATVEETVTRAFRVPFLFAAALAAASLVLGVTVGRRLL
jgi:predicted MFS family arabinose efflux permease